MNATRSEDADEFRSRWGGYLDGLERLETHLDDAQIEILEDSIDQLDQLVDVAAEQRQERDQQ